MEEDSFPSAMTTRKSQFGGSNLRQQIINSGTVNFHPASGTKPVG